MLRIMRNSRKVGSRKRRHLLDGLYLKPQRNFVVFFSTVFYKPSTLLLLSASLRLCLEREVCRFLTDKMCPCLKDTDLIDLSFQKRDVSGTKVLFKSAGWRLCLRQKGKEEREDGGGGRGNSSEWGGGKREVKELEGLYGLMASKSRTQRAGT